MRVNIYLESIFNMVVLLFATLADLDIFIRVVAGLLGCVLALFTIIKLFFQIKAARAESKIKEIEAKQKEEEHEGS